MKQLFLIVFAAPIICFSQQEKNIIRYEKHLSPTKNCVCEWKGVIINYPDKAVEDSISGDVIFEIQVDSSHLMSRPKMIKGIGHGCDEEALKSITYIIEKENECQRKCQMNDWLAIGIITRKITFSLN